MSEIKIQIFLIGKVCVAPELPFGASITARSRRLTCWIESRNGSGCRFRPISSSARTGTFCSTAAGTRYEPARRL